MGWLAASLPLATRLVDWSALCACLTLVGQHDTAMQAQTLVEGLVR